MSRCGASQKNVVFTTKKFTNDGSETEHAEKEWAQEILAGISIQWFQPSQKKKKEQSTHHHGKHKGSLKCTKKK